MVAEIIDVQFLRHMNSARSTPQSLSSTSLSLSSNETDYRRDIDGLRAIAVLSVVCFHAFPDFLRGGFVGVDIFFVISGFLISGKIFENLENHCFSYRDFYARRIRRLFPALLFVLTSCMVIGWFVLLSNEYEFLGKHTATGLSFLANFALWREAANYFNSEVDTRPLLHLWSLGIEEQFYIVWPPILFLIWKFKKHFLSIVLALMALSFSMGLYYILTKDTVSAFYVPWSRFWELFAGGVLAYLMQYRTAAVAAWPQSRQLMGLLLIAAAVICLNDGLPFPGWWAAVPVVGAFLVLSSLKQTPVAGAVLTNPVMVWFGLISYPLYLWHWPVLSFARIVTGSTPAAAYRVAAVAATVVLAWLTYAYVEKPLRHPKRKGMVVTLLCAVALLLCGYGYVLWKLDTVNNRAIDQKFPDFGKAYNATRYSDGSCERLLNKKPLNEEVCLTNSAEPEILVVGDSHGLALNSAAKLGLVPMKTLIIAAHSCMLYPDFTHRPTFSGNYGNNCRAIAADAVQTALAMPSIKTIIIAHSAAVFTPEQGYISFDYFDETGKSITQYDAFIRGNIRLVDQLKAAGKKLVFFKDTHSLDKNPLDCASRFAETDPALCRISAAEFAQQRQQYNAGVETLKQALPGVDFYETGKTLCNTVFCYANESNRFYFFDKHHLTPFGSEVVLKDYLKKTEGY